MVALTETASIGSEIASLSAGISIARLTSQRLPVALPRLLKR